MIKTILCKMSSFIIILIFSTSAGAKRAPTPAIEPIIHEGVIYFAPHDNGKSGYVEAWDLRSSKKLWTKQVFKNWIFPLIEEDIQWVFISSMEFEKTSLIIGNEKGKWYELNVKTRKVKKIHMPTNNSIEHEFESSAFICPTCYRIDCQDQNKMLELRFSDFGPQIAAYSILESDQDSVNPDEKYNDKVIVYEEGDLNRVKEHISSFQDITGECFYLEYSKGIDYLNNEIEENSISEIGEKLMITKIWILKCFGEETNN